MRERLAVDLDAEAGLLRNRDAPVDHAQLLAGEVAPQSGFAQLARQELDESDLGTRGGEMRRGGDRDSGLPEMRHDGQAALSCHLAHTPRLGEAADAADVGLGDADPALVHELRELVPGRQPFAARDRYGLLLGEAAVSGQIVGPEWRLEEEDVELDPVANHAERRVGVGECVLHVDQQRHLRPDGGAHRCRPPPSCVREARSGRRGHRAR